MTVIFTDGKIWNLSFTLPLSQTLAVTRYYLNLQFDNVCCNVHTIKKSHYNLETMRLRGRTRNRWQDEVREDGRLVGGKGWKETVCNRNGRSSGEWQGIVTFSTSQWNEWINYNLFTSAVFRRYAQWHLPNDFEIKETIQ